MDKVKNYLLSTKEEYLVTVNGLKINRSRIIEQIDDAELKLLNLKKNIDTSYMILSSSQIANFEETTEISTLDTIINDKKTKLSIIESEIDNILNKISFLDELLESYNPPDIVNKLLLISKLIDVDSQRAKIEINSVIDDFIKVSGKEI